MDELEQKRLAWAQAADSKTKTAAVAKDLIEDVSVCEDVYLEAVASAGLHSEQARRKRDSKGGKALFLLYLIMFLIMVFLMSIHLTWIGILFMIIAILVIRGRDKKNPGNNETSYPTRARFFQKYGAFIPRGTELPWNNVKQKPEYTGEADHIELERLSGDKRSQREEDYDPDYDFI